MHATHGLSDLADFATCFEKLVPSHQLKWKCKKALSKRKVVFLHGSGHFHVSWWAGNSHVLLF